MKTTDIDCKIGDIVKMIWIDVGAQHELYPISKIETLICEFREDFESCTYGEVIYFKNNEIAITYSRNDEKARVIYMRTELIKSINVLVPRQSPTV